MPILLFNNLYNSCNKFNYFWYYYIMSTQKKNYIWRKFLSKKNLYRSKKSSYIKKIAAISFGTHKDTCMEKRKRETETAIRGEETSDISRSYIRLPAKKSVRRAAREQISLLSKQLLGIAVTQRGSGPYTAGHTKRQRGACVVYEESKSGRGWWCDGVKEGGGVGEANEVADEENKKLPYEAFRIFQFGGGRWGRCGTSVSGRPVDKRVVRTVLNRSEYLYAGPAFAPFLPLSSSPSSQSSRFHFRQRYLLDYPVLINSSGFIFIFLPRREVADHAATGGQTDRFFVY